VLFCAEGFNEIEDVIGAFFADVDDDMVDRLMHGASAST
jgi:phenylalanine-4-hydroxylase